MSVDREAKHSGDLLTSSQRVFIIFATSPFKVCVCLARLSSRECVNMFSLWPGPDQRVSTRTIPNPAPSPAPAASAPTPALTTDASPAPRGAVAHPCGSAAALLKRCALTGRTRQTYWVGMWLKLEGRSTAISRNELNRGR